MSDPVPLPDPLEAAEIRSCAADQNGPVPGRLDLDRSQEAVPSGLLGSGPAGPPRRLTETADPEAAPAATPVENPELPRRPPRRRGRRLVAPALPATPLTPQQRLLLLDTWQRSGLPAGDFAARVGVSKHTL